MNKKLLSMALSLVMMLGTFTSVFAADTKTSDKKEETKKAEEVKKVVGKANKVQYLVDHKIVEGNEKGELELNNPIKRSEITKILVYANGNEKLAKQLQGTMQIYTDVTPSFWANGVITVGTTVPSDSNKQAMLNGYPDRSFKPENNVTYAEAAKMLVVLAKKDLTADMVKEANKNWAAQWMTWAAELGILKDVDVKDSNAAATREDVFTMMYNALYAMKNIKNEASNEKVGVLSKLNKDVLVLNQDAKENEYKITDNTVYVDENFNEVKSGYLKKVKAISNPEYYLGSLVRVLVNDKKEVTHILELGNPENGALYNKNAKVTNEKGYTIVKDNERWNGLADDTVSTTMLKADKYGKVEAATNDSYVTFGLNSSDTKVKKIVFHANNNDAVRELKVKDSTKIYVADQRNNNLKEVKDMDEAIKLLGYKDVNNRIYSVYAGYDDESLTTAQNSKFEEGTAKYVVFNKTNKDNNVSDNYRIETVPGNNGLATLLNTDNEKVDEDFFKFSNLFPLSTFDQYDVVEISSGADGKVNAKRELKHSDYDVNPTVKVVKSKQNGKVLEVEGEGYKAVLFTDGADLFGKSSLSKLEKGDVIQIQLDKDSTSKQNRNVVSIVSYLKDAKVEGRKFKESGIIKTVQDNGAIVTIKSVGQKSVDLVSYDLTDKDDLSNVMTYDVDEYLANTLRAVIAISNYKDAQFKVDIKDGEVYNVSVFVGDKEVKLQPAKDDNAVNTQIIAIANQEALNLISKAKKVVGDSVTTTGAPIGATVKTAVAAKINADNELNGKVTVDGDVTANEQKWDVTLKVVANTIDLAGQHNLDQSERITVSATENK